MNVKFLTITGAAGAAISHAFSYVFGGFDVPMQGLLVFMVIDYLMGMACAAFFKKSTKTESGGLSSAAGFKGLAKKCGIIGLVAVATWADIITGTNFIRNGVCIAFIANEALSIIENAGQMGIKIPAPLKNAVDILKSKGEKG